MVLANTYTHTYKTALCTNGKKYSFSDSKWNDTSKCNACTDTFCTFSRPFAERERRNKTTTKTTAAIIKKHKKCRGNFYFCQKNHSLASRILFWLRTKWAWHLKLNGSHLMLYTKRLLEIKNCFRIVLVSWWIGGLPWKHLFFINFYPQFYCTWQRIDSHLKFKNSLSVLFFL